MSLFGRAMQMGGVIDSGFSPLDIAGCEAWFDASNAGSITQTGGLVDQWSDLSGNGHHVTAVLGLRPTTGTRTQNGLNVIDFVGSDGLNSTTTFLYDLVTTTIFVVFMPDADPASILSYLVGEGNISDFRPEYAVRNSATQCNFVYVTNGNVVKFNIVDGDPTNATPHRIVATDSGTEAIIEMDDGTPVSSGAYTRATTTMNRFNIGMLNNQTFTAGGRFLDGWIAEIIIYDSVLSSGNITTVEGYLDTKWGL